MKNKNQEAVEIMEEIKLIAKAKNICLPEDIVAKTMGKAAGFPPGRQPLSNSIFIQIKEAMSWNYLEVLLLTMVKN